MLDDSSRMRTVASIARAQLPDGTIPWMVGGRWDPWDHVECALALDSGGLHDRARCAYRHLARTQRHDGAWACPIVGGRENEEVLDSNGASYIATGVWHHYLCTGDEGALHELWPVVERGIDFAVDLQMPSGAVAWARNLEGHPGDHALLAGCSSIAASLRCALSIAETMGETRLDWELSLTSLLDAIRRESDFAERSRYSMDWYYPLLSGALDRESAARRVARRWDAFVVDGLGARCVDDRPWITSAETAELAIALEVCGMHDEARQLFGWVQYLRFKDGSYWTGATFPDGRHFPNERSNWSAAAIILANDVLASRGPIGEVFRSGALSSVPASGRGTNLP